MKNYGLKNDAVKNLQDRANKIIELIHDSRITMYEKDLASNVLFVHALGRAEESILVIQRFLSGYGEENINEESISRYGEYLDNTIKLLQSTLEQVLQGNRNIDTLYLSKTTKSYL